MNGKGLTLFWNLLTAPDRLFSLCFFCVSKVQTIILLTWIVSPNFISFDGFKTDFQIRFQLDDH